MSRKKIAVIIAGVMAVVLLGAGLWAVVAHNNSAKALDEATAAYTKAGTALEKVVSTVDTAGCTDNGGNKDTCAAMEKAVADAKAGLAEKPGKDAAKVKEAAAKREKLAGELAELSKKMATEQANATAAYLDKECPLHLDPECDSLRKGDLKLPEAKVKVEAVKARHATPEAPAAPAPVGNGEAMQVPAPAGGSSHGTGGGNADSGYSEPAYEAPEPAAPAPVEEAAASAPAAPERTVVGGYWECSMPAGTSDTDCYLVVQYSDGTTEKTNHYRPND
ncbi:hypothetical protein ACRQD2_07205 [Actinotignum sp. GS-2025e]|uniref:hypothetical protein n=1 Tax=Actinotignum TaxID=1653174 RepID=UPI00254B95FB|nr:hypothetical protein [Actinotignum timonense]MDK6906447.1 hypothetical protein [Actinotignum timonense]MDK8781526.1 hypothetical protein [Actinotignum timonense]MDY5137889.1 hypothetical protein [Actinotignum timonense]